MTITFKTTYIYKVRQKEIIALKAIILRNIKEFFINLLNTIIMI